MVYSSSGTYVDTASNANACDSVVTLILTINTGSIDELISSSTSPLIKITDLAGREMDLTKGQVMLLYYSDGAIKRIYIKE
jgi:hypothetical protein